MIRRIGDTFATSVRPWLRTGTGGEDLRHERLLVLLRDVPGGAAEGTAVRAAWPAPQSTVLADSAATERRRRWAPSTPVSPAAPRGRGAARGRARPAARPAHRWVAGRSRHSL